MPKSFHKHKILLDEQLYHRRLYPLLNEHFDVKHVRDDLHLSGLPDPKVYELALSQGRIIFTKNVKDFRPLLRADSPGIVGIPDTWSAIKLDTALTALLMRHGPNYFRGQFRPSLRRIQKKRLHKHSLKTCISSWVLRQCFYYVYRLRPRLNIRPNPRSPKGRPARQGATASSLTRHPEPRQSAQAWMKLSATSGRAIAEMDFYAFRDAANTVQYLCGYTFDDFVQGVEGFRLK